MTKTVQTPRCIVCKARSTLELTDEEYAALEANAVSIQRALPGRDAGFRELVKTGTHPACWDKMFEGGE